MIEDELIKKYEKYLRGLDIYENENNLILSRIVINDNNRESGIGSKIMSDLVAYADQNNKIVALSPSDDFGGTKGRLIKFYKRFGFVPNKGKHKDYEFKETMIRYPNLNEDKIPGGLSDKYTTRDLAKKHSVNLSDINKQLKKGVEVELEHTNDTKIAREIAMDHIYENPKYYDLLSMVDMHEQKFLIKNLISERFK